MLRELTVTNLVIVERARLVPSEGLTAITGETGAGKSLLLDALDLIAGGRASAELVGPRGEACEVCADFLVETTRAAQIHEACGIADADGAFILRRRLRNDGRSLDSAPQAGTRRGAGMALANIRQRLLTRYGSAAHLTMSALQPGTLARITLPLETAP